MLAVVSVPARAIRSRSGRVSALRHRLVVVEAERRAQTARLHEVTSMVASISSAWKLISEMSPSSQRDDLTVMAQAELERLQRMLSVTGLLGLAIPPAGVPSTDLDEVIDRLVELHRSRGSTVGWSGSGLQVTGPADEVAQVLNALLDNAACHGAGTRIEVSAHRVDDAIEIAVADCGPGVAPELADRLFDWGARRNDSPGQGVGLHTAERVAHALGGDLRLDGRASSARFVLRLPDVRAHERPTHGST